jgi:hypothetical protein
LTEDQVKLTAGGWSVDAPIGEPVETIRPDSYSIGTVSVLSASSFSIANKQVSDGTTAFTVCRYFDGWKQQPGWKLGAPTQVDRNGFPGLRYETRLPNGMVPISFSNDPGGIPGDAAQYD